MPEEEDVHCFQQRILSCTSFSLVLLLLLDYLYQGPLLRAQNLFFFPSKFSHQNSSLIFQHYIRPKKTRRKSKKKMPEGTFSKCMCRTLSLLRSVNYAPGNLSQNNSYNRS